MIRITDLTKRYPQATAVDRISFEVQRGEVLGFLGPNGAGKTTTLRILSGFLPATSGRVTVDGLDIAARSLEVRRRIGYLPENVPLYPEMRVNEYLTYRAQLKRVPRRQRGEAVARALEQCALGDVRGQVLGRLSRGYCQRVGLADALLGDPPVLVLDEPTVGLDPHQIRQVRHLIKGLGGAHTIILSSHILPEVEMVCSRVVIIDQGRIVAQDAPEVLRHRLRGAAVVLVELRGGDVADVRGALEDLEGVQSADVQAVGELRRCRVTVEAGRDVREAMFGVAAVHGWGLRELTYEHTTLEDLFVQLTTREQSG